MDNKCFDKFVAFLAAVMFSQLGWAQADLPFVPEGQEQKVAVVKRTVLYPFDEFEYDRYRIKKAADDRISYKVELGDLKRKKASRDCMMDVVGFARTAVVAAFDLYIVRDDAGAYYYLEASACPDKWLIDDKNARILDEFEAKKELLNTNGNSYAK